MRKINLLFSFLLFPLFMQATGIMGSDLTWTCVGKDSFIIELILIADCNQASPENLMLSFYCTTDNALIKTISLNNPNPIDITPTCNNITSRCEDPQSTFPFGIHEYTYDRLAILDEAGSCCEIRVAFTSCCWDSSLTTIKNPGNKNFYTETILNRCIKPFYLDISPKYTNPPVAIICQGEEFVYCNGLEDNNIDPKTGGSIDSLGFEITTPLTSKDTALDYNFPYASNKPLYFKGFPDENAVFPLGFHVDTVSCDISFIPMALQQTVMAIKTNVFRNGIKVWEINRNYCFIIIDCPPDNSPILLTDTFFKETVAGKMVTFTIPTFDPDSTDSVTILWNHGIAGATWSANKEKIRCPTGILTWTPNITEAQNIPYSFIVTVKDNHCPVAGSYSRVFQVMVNAPVSINKLINKLNFSLFPNPNKGSFNISLPGNSGNDIEISITDLPGKVLFCRRIERQKYGGDIVIDQTGLNKGIYFIKISNNGMQGVEKFVVE